MSIWTREELTEHIAATKAAIKKALDAASYGTGSRNLQRQSLDQLNAQLRRYQDELAALDGRRGPLFVTARPRR